MTLTEAHKAVDDKYGPLVDRLMSHPSAFAFYAIAGVMRAWRDDKMLVDWKFGHPEAMVK